jgi:hypothetical protein
MADLAFDGSTFVAFSDLSGFKNMIRGDAGKAYEALNCLYTEAYHYLDGCRNVGGLAVSDCVVAWAIDAGVEVSVRAKAEAILDFLKALHRGMLQRSYLVTTTIAWGRHTYQRRIELSNFRKDLLTGSAYIEAYIRNGSAEKGSISLLRKGCDWDPTREAQTGAMWRKTRGGWEFFWCTDEPVRIPRIEDARREAKRMRGTIRFETLIQILRGEPPLPTDNR